MFVFNFKRHEEHSHLQASFRIAQPPQDQKLPSLPEEPASRTLTSCIPVIVNLHLRHFISAWGLSSIQEHILKRGKSSNFRGSLGVKRLMLIKEKGEVSECKEITSVLWPAHWSRNVYEVTVKSHPHCTLWKWPA